MPTRKYLGIDVNNTKKLQEVSKLADLVHDHSSMTTIKLMQLSEKVNTVRDKKRLEALRNNVTKINVEMTFIKDDIENIINLNSLEKHMKALGKYWKELTFQDKRYAEAVDIKRRKGKAKRKDVDYIEKMVLKYSSKTKPKTYNCKNCGDTMNVVDYLVSPYCKKCAVREHKKVTRSNDNKLTSVEIEQILKLKNFEKAKRIAVENFLMTSTTKISKSDAIKNLMMDKKLYNWNAPTVNAIKYGLNKLYRK